MKKSILIFPAFVLFACSAPKIYTAAGFNSSKANAKIVAILPAEVNIQLRPNEANNINAETLKEQSIKTGYNFQEKVYTWFLDKQSKYHYSVSFQDVSLTNSKIKNAGITYEDLKYKDKSEIAKLLGFDAVIQTKISSEKPMSEAASIAIQVLFDPFGGGATNKVEAIINIYDGPTGTLLWTYDYSAAGNIGSSTSTLVDYLMKNASKNFPYKNSK